MIQSAGIVVVKKQNNKWKYLLLRRGDYFDFCKGKLDEGETHIQAAIRETKEEADIDDLGFHWGNTFTETEPYAKPLKVARYYLAELMSGEARIIPNPKTGLPEHDEICWLSYEDAIKLDLKPRIELVIKWANDRVIKAKF